MHGELFRLSTVISIPSMRLQIQILVKGSILGLICNFYKALFIQPDPQTMPFVISNLCSYNKASP